MFFLFHNTLSHTSDAIAATMGCEHLPLPNGTMGSKGQLAELMVLTFVDPGRPQMWGAICEQSVKHVRHLVVLDPFLQAQLRHGVHMRFPMVNKFLNLGMWHRASFISLDQPMDAQQARGASNQPLPLLRFQQFSISFQ